MLSAGRTGHLKEGYIGCCTEDACSFPKGMRGIASRNVRRPRTGMIIMISHHLQIHLVSKLYEIERFGEVETEIMSCGMYSIINWRELIRLFQRSLSVYNIFVVVRIIISYIDLTCVKLVIISNIWWFRQISYGYWMYIFFPAILSRFHNSEIIWNVLIFFFTKKKKTKFFFCNILIRTRDGHYHMIDDFQ